MSSFPKTGLIASVLQGPKFRLVHRVAFFPQLIQHFGIFLLFYQGPMITIPYFHPRTRSHYSKAKSTVYFSVILQPNLLKVIPKEWDFVSIFRTSKSLLRTICHSYFRDHIILYFTHSDTIFKFRVNLTITFNQVEIHRS